MKYEMKYELTLIVIYRGKLYCIFNLFLCCFQLIFRVMEWNGMEWNK